MSGTGEMTGQEGHERYDAFPELYALGALDARDRARFEQHLASGCRVCEEELHQARHVAEAFSMSSPPLSPPDRVKSRLLERIGRDSARARPRSVSSERHSAQSRSDARSWLSTWSGLAAAAALILAGGLGLYARSLLEQIEAERDLRTTLESELTDARRLADSLSSPRNQAVTLTGQDPSPGARATAFVDSAAGRLFLYVENLPALDPSQTYQIWIIVDEIPSSVGTFNVAADGSARLDSQPLPDVQGLVTVAVTVEPAGGVPQPTGPIVLVGT